MDYMQYKTILVHVDQSAQAAQRIGVAAQLALRDDAHLVGTALTNLSPLVFAGSGIDPAMPPVLVPFDLLRAEAARALDAFEAQVSALGVLSFERRLVEEEAGLGVSMQARYCDLVVIGQHDAAAPVPRLRADFPEYVLLNSARPVLLVPSAPTEPAPGRRILVAWNGSAQATRAIASALGMLQRAHQVDLLVMNPAGEGDLHGPAPGADMARYLARHGVKVEVRSLDRVDDPGATLLATAGGAGADLIVMGGYGHARLRELLLGGVTRTVLASSTLPLWMAH